MIQQLLYLFTGAIAGLLSGLLGVGGGIVVVPILTVLFASIFPSDLLMHMASGTSLAIMMFTTASSTYAYQRHGLVRWPLFYRFTPGMVLGTITGAVIAMHLSSKFLQMAFAVFLFIVALKMFDTRKTHAERQLPRQLGLSIVSFCSGSLSGFFGVGGGTLIVPFFVYCNVVMQQATATSAVCGLMLAIVGTISFMITGLHTVQIPNMPLGTAGFVYWPAVLPMAIASMIFAPIGTRMAVSLSSIALQRIFAIALLVTAYYLLK